MKAIGDFQAECPVIFKGTQGHKYTYADLTDIYEVINPILRKHGLVVIQPLQDGGIRTIVYHTPSEEVIDCFIIIPEVKLAMMNDYQAFGSGITYFRRYALSSFLRIVTDADNDAQGKQIEDKKQEKISSSRKGSMNDVTMLKLVARYNDGEKDVFDRASQHFELREKDLQIIKTLINGGTI